MAAAIGPQKKPPPRSRRAEAPRPCPVRDFADRPCLRWPGAGGSALALEFPGCFAKCACYRTGYSAISGGGRRLLRHRRPGSGRVRRGIGPVRHRCVTDRRRSPSIMARRSNHMAYSCYGRLRVRPCVLRAGFARRNCMSTIPLDHRRPLSIYCMAGRREVPCCCRIAGNVGVLGFRLAQHVRRPSSTRPRLP